MFFICVDAHSKWPEVIEMSKTTAIRTIAELRKLFAAHGLSEQIVTDNGPQFTSDKFSIFSEPMESNTFNVHLITQLQMGWLSGL